MRFAMLELRVTDLVQSATWYEQCLGYRVVLKDEPNGFYLLDGPPGGQLALKQGTPTPGVILHYEVSHLDAEVSRLGLLGIDPHSPTKFGPDGYKRVLYLDPDGYTICLFRWT